LKKVAAALTDPELMASGKIVVDILEQCAAIGDLHHAFEARAIATGKMYAMLGDIIAGRNPGRTPEEETIIFDSTGTALQNVAAA
jgi:alanine dehydrogenase